MAKKKNDKGGGLILLLFLLLALAILATPVVMVLGSVFSLISYIKISSRIKGKYSDFWLSTSGKERFKTVSEKLVEAVEILRKQKGLEIKKDWQK